MHYTLLKAKNIVKRASPPDEPRTCQNPEIYVRHLRGAQGPAKPRCMRSRLGHITQPGIMTVKQPLTRGNPPNNLPNTLINQEPRHKSKGIITTVSSRELPQEAPEQRFPTKSKLFHRCNLEPKAFAFRLVQNELTSSIYKDSANQNHQQYLVEQEFPLLLNSLNHHTAYIEIPRIEIGLIGIHR